jgi:hypothetical protein
VKLRTRRPDRGIRIVERYLARLEARRNPTDYMRALKIAVRWYCMVLVVVLLGCETPTDPSVPIGTYRCLSSTGPVTDFVRLGCQGHCVCT